MASTRSNKRKPAHQQTRGKGENGRKKAKSNGGGAGAPVGYFV
jgi:hypothetical protein